MKKSHGPDVPGGGTHFPHADDARFWLAAIVESSDDAIISKDTNGIITSWNSGARRLFGYTAAEAIGQSVTMLIPDDRRDEEPRIIARIRRGERVEHYETIRRRKDGALLHISLTVSPILDASGRVVGASKIARDITERVKANERLEQARAEAEAANRAKDEFLAMLGHELRNPLAAVRNATAAAMLDETNRQRALEIAVRQTDQLGRIVDDLLDVARITRGRVPLHRERVTLGDVLRRSVEGAQALMDERGHELTLTIEDERVEVDADPSRLQQVMANLLSNAAKYSQPGGRITVMGERDGDTAVIRVRDRGIGIAPELLPNVFDLFAQGRRTPDRAQGGLGIGLTLVRRILELHGGSAEAVSPGEGQGAEFVLRLPAMPASRERPRPRAETGTATRARTPARVLMVEDHPDAAESLVMLLELLGHHVRVVHEGGSALEAARANPPDLMLIDIGLPGMSGYDVARAVRGDAALKHLVLVALTGYGQPEDKVRSMEAGFDYHLVKPVDLEDLGSLVARVAETNAERPSGPERTH